MNNEYAFPIVEDNNYEGQLVMEARYKGLTKREWFAGMALQGFLANAHTGGNGYGEQQTAEWAFKQADAMIKESEKSAQ